jgi:hypothetical protein
MAELTQQRLDSEWLAASALRELIHLATEGDGSKATYPQAMALGEKVLPGLLGPDSLLKRGQESDVAAEYRQRARAKAMISGKDVSPIELLSADIAEYEALVQSVRNEQRVTELKRRLTRMQRALRELDTTRHNETELIFRDARHVTRKLPEIGSGQGHHDFALSNRNVLRIRVFHPDQQEHISGADVLYERHNSQARTANIVAVQYKIWEDKLLYLNDARMQRQLTRMKAFFCDTGVCQATSKDQFFRFPHCSAFLRPTDRLQDPSQRLASSGEHIPICEIAKIKSAGPRGADVLSYEKIRESSLSQDEFQGLFTTGKLGSRTLTYQELTDLYRRLDLSDPERLLIHAQDFEEPMGV